MKEVKKNIEVTELAEVSNETEAKTEEVVEKKGFVQEHKKAITIGAIGAGLLTVVGLVWAAVKKSPSPEPHPASFDVSDNTSENVETEEF